MKTKTYAIKGITPLLMHNSQLANPLAPIVKDLKKITGKRKKTDDDHEALMRLETLGGLYWNEHDGIHMPGENIEACLLAAAKLRKLGTTFKRGLQVVDTACEFKHKQEKDPQKFIQKDSNVYVKSVKIGQQRVMRSRPIFHDWSTKFQIMFDPEVLDEEQIDEVVNDAGRYIGLCDWRPRFGKFEVI